MLSMAAATAATVTTYFFAPLAVWRAVFHPFADLSLFMGVAVGTAIIGADLLWVRRAFCRRACPYGMMLSLIGDRNTMTVRYLWERNDDCIKCGQCVTVCPMGIDIKDGPNQMECIGCGECIDACNDILPMLKQPKPGLIELRYGVDPMRTMKRLTPAQKLGLWDGRRVLVFSTLLLLCVGGGAELYGTAKTSLSVTPLGSIVANQSFVRESYRVIVTNGRPEDTDYALSVQGLPGVTVLTPDGPISVPRSGEKMVTLVLAAPRAGLMPQTRYPIRLTAQAPSAPRERHSATAIFYVPAGPPPAKGN